MSLEEVLLALLFAYFAVFILLGITKGRKYLKSYSEPSGKEYLFHSLEVTLMLAGLSITALALFISFGLQNLEQLSWIILFFSISFVALTLSSKFARFPRRVYTFIADVLADMGILAIGCGFLVFFEHHLQWTNGLVLTYSGFIAFFLILSFLELYKYYKYWLLFDGTKSVKAKRGKQPRNL